MRKHLYLSTEHEEEDRVGLFEIADSRRSRSLKNEEGPIHVLDRESKSFKTTGKRVGLGYHDFEDEEDYEERLSDVLESKMADIDDKWLRKAGHEDKIEEGATA